MARVKILPQGTSLTTHPLSPQHLDAIQTLQTRRMQTGRSRQDTWFNSRSRFGTNADPVIVSNFIRSRSRMDREQAEALFEFDWLAARICEQMPKDATREWISFKHEKNPAIAEKLRKEDERLHGRSLFKDVMTWGNLHGGSLLVLGAFDGTDPESPLTVERVRKVMFVHTVDRWLSFPSSWYQDRDDPLFGQVEIYRINRLSPIGSPTSMVHESRVIRFEGNPISPLARVRNWGWGASVLDKVYDALRNWGISNQAAASVIPSFITVAMQIGNLQQLIQNKDFATIQARMAEFSAQMATHNMAFYGPDEKLEKLGTPVTGLPELLDKFMGVVSAAGDMPKSILFQSETGSLGGNAANTDQDNWFNKVVSVQEVTLRPKIRRWLDVIGVPIGIAPGEVEFEFNNLKKLTAKEEGDLYLQTMQADQIAINSGMIDAPERMAVYRFGGDQYNSTPPVINTTRMEKFLVALEEEPIIAHDPRAEEGAGLEGSAQDLESGELGMEKTKQGMEQSALNIKQQQESFDADGKPNEPAKNRLNALEILDAELAKAGEKEAIRIPVQPVYSGFPHIDSPIPPFKIADVDGYDKEYFSSPRTMTIRASRDPDTGDLIAHVTEGGAPPRQDSKIKLGVLPHPPQGVQLNSPEHTVWAMVKDSKEGVTVDNVKALNQDPDVLGTLVNEGHLVEREGSYYLPEGE